MEGKFTPQGELSLLRGMVFWVAGSGQLDRGERQNNQKGGSGGNRDQKAKGHPGLGWPAKQCSS